MSNTIKTTYTGLPQTVEYKGHVIVDDGKFGITVDGEASTQMCVEAVKNEIDKEERFNPFWMVFKQGPYTAQWDIDNSLVKITNSETGKKVIHEFDETNSRKAALSYLFNNQFITADWAFEK